MPQLPIFLQPLLLLVYWKNQCLLRLQSAGSRLSPWFRQSRTQLFGPLEQAVAAVVIVYLALHAQFDQSLPRAPLTSNTFLNRTRGQHVYSAAVDIGDTPSPLESSLIDWTDLLQGFPNLGRIAMPLVALLLTVVNLILMFLPQELKARLKHSWDVFWPPWQDRTISTSKSDGLESARDRDAAVLGPPESFRSQGPQLSGKKSRETHAAVLGPPESFRSQGPQLSGKKSRETHDNSNSSPLFDSAEALLASAKSKIKAGAVDKLSHEEKAAYKAYTEEKGPKATEVKSSGKAMTPTSIQPEERKQDDILALASAKVKDGKPDMLTDGEKKAYKTYMQTNAGHREETENTHDDARSQEAQNENELLARAKSKLKDEKADSLTPEEKAAYEAYVKRKTGPEEAGSGERAALGSSGQGDEQALAGAKAKIKAGQVQALTDKEKAAYKAYQARKMNKQDAKDGPKEQPENEKQRDEGKGKARMEGERPPLPSRSGADPRAVSPPAVVPSTWKDGTSSASDTESSVKPPKSSLKPTKTTRQRQSKNIHHNHFMTMRGWRPALIPFPHGLHPPPTGPRNSLWWDNVPQHAGHLMAKEKISKEPESAGDEEEQGVGKEGKGTSKEEKEKGDKAKEEASRRAEKDKKRDRAEKPSNGKGEEAGKEEASLEKVRKSKDNKGKANESQSKEIPSGGADEAKKLAKMRATQDAQAKEAAVRADDKSKSASADKSPMASRRSTDKMSSREPIDSSSPAMVPPPQRAGLTLSQSKNEKALLVTQLLLCVVVYGMYAQLGLGLGALFLWQWLEGRKDLKGPWDTANPHSKNPERPAAAPSQGRGPTRASQESALPNSGGAVKESNAAAASARVSADSRQARSEPPPPEPISGDRHAASEASARPLQTGAKAPSSVHVPTEKDEHTSALSSPKQDPSKRERIQSPGDLPIEQQEAKLAQLARKRGSSFDDVAHAVAALRSPVSLSALKNTHVSKEGQKDGREKKEMGPEEKEAYLLERAKRKRQARAERNGTTSPGAGSSGLSADDKAGLI